jgi:hypothetical protein
MIVLLVDFFDSNAYPRKFDVWCDPPLKIVNFKVAISIQEKRCVPQIKVVFPSTKRASDAIARLITHPSWSSLNVLVGQAVSANISVIPEWICFVTCGNTRSSSQLCSGVLHNFSHFSVDL